MKYKILSVLTCLILLGGSWFSYKNAMARPLVKENGKIVDIPKGASFKVVIELLKAQEVDINPFWFKCVAYLNQMADKIQAGEYELKPGITTYELLQQLVGGRVIKHSVTFPEGWCFKEMLALLANVPGINHTLDVNSASEQVSKQLGLDIKHPEGWFFPDTYQFTKNTSDIELLKRAHQRMQSVLQEEWAQKQGNVPLDTPYQALILASIVEKETRLTEERPKIAGVFSRRLQKGMLLQTDPTVIYGMGEDYKGNIRHEDLRNHTPYNTYVISGLPPTPIAMPGREAIHAALHPEEGDSLYFVARGDGGHEFTSNLGEHNRAVSKYQLHRHVAKVK